MKLHVRVIYVVRRPGEETTAVVRAKVLPEIVRTTDFLAALQGAVTEWVGTTDTGEDVFEDVGRDLNVGDLSTFDDEKLNSILAIRGILDLDVHTTEGDAEWTFDTPLVNESELEEEAR
jgi:hypothetical protein